MFLLAILTRGDLKVAIEVLIDTAPVEGRRVAMHFLLFFLLFFLLPFTHFSPFCCFPIARSAFLGVDFVCCCDLD